MEIGLGLGWAGLTVTEEGEGGVWTEWMERDSWVVVVATITFSVEFVGLVWGLVVGFGG